MSCQTKPRPDKNTCLVVSIYQTDITSFFFKIIFHFICLDLGFLCFFLHVMVWFRVRVKFVR